MHRTAMGYAAEQARLELALRLIRHEARTCTIRSCTGLSDDRIRRLVARYFKGASGDPVRRHRGKSPSRTRVYVKTPVNQCEATTLAMLFLVFDLLRVLPDGRLLSAFAEDGVRFGGAFCMAFETYDALHGHPHLSFERAWTLCRALASGKELVLLDCGQCDGIYVHHLLELDDRRCPCCKLKGVAVPRGRGAAMGFEGRRRRAAQRAGATHKPLPQVAEPD